MQIVRSSQCLWQEQADQRLCGEVFGSALTFGAAKKASAPGQAAVNDLNNMLQFLHENQGL